MNPAGPSREPDSALRAQAEARMGPAAADDLLHQLHVHQIELEMQNENLQKSLVALEESRDRFVDFYDFAPVGYLTLDEHGLIADLNLPATELLGLERGQARRRSFSQFIVAEDQDRWYQHLVSALHYPEKRVCELALKQDQGRPRHVRLDCLRLVKNGQATSLRMVLTDITAHKAAEQATLAAAQYARSLLEASLDPLVTISAQGKISDVNLATEKVTGVAREDLIGSDFSDYFTDPDQAREGYRRVFEQGMVTDYALAIRHVSGRITDVLYNASVYRDAQGEVLGVFAAARDITEHKRAEAELERHRQHLEELVFSRTAELAAARDAAEAANRAKSVFLANTSHELRTPMNAIMGFTNLALRHASDAKLIDHLSRSMAAAQRLLALISNILDVSRIESEQLTLQDRNFSLATLVDEAFQMQQAAASAKGLGLHREIAALLPDLLRGDAPRLRQIVLNLLENAIKFSERGDINLRAYAVEEDSHSLLLRIEVTDQGVGLSAEQQTWLFQPFTQVDGSTTRKYGGSGLGLFITRRVARLMGGDAGVSSQEGLGSTFWVTARLKRVVTGEQVELPADGDSPCETLAQRFPGARILVADEESVNREITVFLLEDVGLVPEVVDNGLEAVARANSGDYALILMGMDMPLMNGVAAAQAIRQLPGLAAIPILALCSKGSEEQRELCRAAGIDAQLSKPVDPDPLYAKVLDLLRQSAASQASAASP